MERRRPEAYRLRVSIDALKQAKSTTSEDWLNAHLRVATPESVIPSQVQFIRLLELSVLDEAELFATEIKEAA